jgi:hypothetical protein
MGVLRVWGHAEVQKARRLKVIEAGLKDLGGYR